MPPASRVQLGAGRTLALVATLWLLAVGIWEIAAPFGHGRDAGTTAIAVGGENMLRWGTALPVTEQTLTRPTLEHVTLERPFGVYWLSALFSALFGHHDWVVRLPAVLASALTPGLLYALGRALYGPIAGGLSALGFVTVPVTLSLVQVSGFEVPLSCAALLTLLAYVRLRQTGRRAFVLLAVLGMSAALNVDWPGLPFVLALLAIAFVRTFVVAAPAPREFDALARLSAWGALLVAVFLVYYGWLFHAAGRLPEVFAPAPPLELGKPRLSEGWLSAQRFELLSAFTPLVPALTACAAPLMLVRTVAFRREVELVPLTVFVLGAAQLALFRRADPAESALPHAFAVFFGLSLGALHATAAGISTRVARRFASGRSNRLQPGLPAVVALLFVPLFALLGRDALAALLAMRKTGWRAPTGEGALLQQADKVAAFGFWSKQLAEDSGVVLDANLLPAPWMSWVLDRPIRTRESEWSRDRDRYYALDARFADSGRLRRMAEGPELLVLGPFFFVDRGRPAGPARVYAIGRREASWLERLFVTSNHSIHELVDDPFHTYEVKHYLSQTPNPAPRIAPGTLEQLRVAHNIAYSQGDVDTARALRERLLAELDRRPATQYRDGTKLLGVHVTRGASQLLGIYFESSGPADQRFVVRSRLESKLPGSLVPLDPRTLEVGVPSFPPRDAWRPSFLYSVLVELLPRPGSERFVGSWIATNADVPLIAESGATEVPLLVLP